MTLSVQKSLRLVAWDPDCQSLTHTFVISLSLSGTGAMKVVITTALLSPSFSGMRSQGWVLPKMLAFECFSVFPALG